MEINQMIGLLPPTTLASAAVTVGEAGGVSARVGVVVGGSRERVAVTVGVLVAGPGVGVSVAGGVTCNSNF